MQSLRHSPTSSSLIILAFHILLLPLVACSSYDVNEKNRTNPKDNIHKLSAKTKSEIAIHGILFWVSMGFLMPLGILAIRMHHRHKGGFRKALFYIHAVFQVLALLLATAGAILSLRSFENSFNNSHQRIGLALYGAIWVQAGAGFLRPHRGNKARRNWYLLHWILGTVVSLFGIYNVYTGLDAYHKKTQQSTRFWTILFSAQLTLLGFFYLCQDKWDYIQKQGVSTTSDVGDDNVLPTTNGAINNQVVAPSDHSRQKVGLPPQPCGKKNALKNLFD